MTSLTLKPHLLRADTIDLQSPQSPSAKDHSRGQYHSGYSYAGSNPGGSHHSQALRNANQEAYQEQHTSPRIGGFDRRQNHPYDDDDDEEDDHGHNGMNGASRGNDYDDMDGNDSQDDDMDDDLMDKISSSPSIEDEDIDFEFVYALHTFVATVEGQANATKGDTMVLLDDSNSYWWLVRVVKDGSIGYLPAEHIETPTERLARLNKHRNIDLSAAMLGDNPEKSKNPLKKAMRRRNAKTVNFAPPTYYEPDEQVWSDEEEDVDDEETLVATSDASSVRSSQQTMQESQQGQQTQNNRELDQGDYGQTANQNNHVSEQQRVQPVSATIHRIDSDNDTEDDEPSSPAKTDAKMSGSAPTSPQDDFQRSRKGVVRNTDSFFKDDSVETKKISLTPHLLRGDSANVVPTDQESKQRPSLDTFDKVVGEEKPKDGKKKEKKGMLSGLFKRKDKGNKAGKQDADEADRISEDSNRSPQSKESMDSDLGSERKPGKLQKVNPASQSPKSSPAETRSPVKETPNLMMNMQPQPQPQPQPQVQPGPGFIQNPAIAPVTIQYPAANTTPEAVQPPVKAAPSDKRSVFAPIAGALRSKNSSQDMTEAPVKAVYSKRAKERFAIDESDSEEDASRTAQSSILHRSISPLDNQAANQGRPDSDIRVSPIGNYNMNSAHSATTNPHPMTKPNVEQQNPGIMAPTSPSDQTASTSKRSPSIPTHTPSTSRSTPTWSDASLRTYMDNDQDIRDLLVIVHDKTNVIPVGADHPLMNGLFAPERTKLADMQTQLDSMLMTWLSKKNQSTMKA